MSAPKSNSNALRGAAPATAWLQVRVEPRRKAAYVRAAQAARLNLSRWIIERLDRAARP